jgi:hypothetical protein
MMSNTPILLFPVVVGYSSATGRIFSWNFPHKKNQLIRHRDKKIRMQVCNRQCQRYKYFNQGVSYILNCYKLCFLIKLNMAS